MRITRRTVCRAGLAALGGTLAGAPAGCATGGYRVPAGTVRIAGGQQGGVYLGFAQRLAGEITSAEPGLDCEARQTNGSQDNIELIRAGDADIGVSQIDIALAAVEGKHPFTAAVPIQRIGRLYEDYVQLVVRADSPIKTVNGLGGHKVSVGPKGSGTATVGERLFAAAGVQVHSDERGLTDAIKALKNKEVSAVLWSGGVPTDLLGAAHEEFRIRPLPIVLSDLPALRDNYDKAYQQVSIPAGAYGPGDTPTIGIANLLVCAKGLAGNVVAAITRVLVDRADRLVPPKALGLQVPDQPTLSGFLGVPMHPGAKAAYQQLYG